MSKFIDFYLIGELVDSHGNVHYEDLKNLPTADVAEVVRCKDCIHYCGYFSKNEVLHCGVFDWLSLPYDYCSTGERREDDKE